MKKLSQEDFILKVRQVHGDKYDLSRVNYVNSTTSVSIGYDGIQHFQQISHFSGLEAFEYRKVNDEIKTKYCGDRNIKLVRISYKEIDNIDSILNKNIII